ncbi:dihydrofolate reductase family protein [Actinomadura barringtoniae]|uniref:Dihydrofolate reductase family protein n=1 Tax=Actinomadura barringtoniae TaxID=1427535 RepID=A0A939T763_9ACTN|nr:dihydrofolate reductase family protein [Actinomadura barringtoniae]MBO2448987.1 dihydrofolate reductase family protein [Actinomadura barringtoniae]
MSKVIANMSMSLDGFIADPADGIDRLFGWMGSGDVEVPTAVEWATFRMSPASAEYMRTSMESVGALITGRHLFDITQGWGGTHPLGVPIVVVTHREAPADWPHTETFTFTGGVEEAVEAATKAAGDKDVVVASAKIAQQCLDAGLLDAVHIDLVPVLLGSGVRWFENLGKSPVQFGDPTVIEGNGVTHLAYEVTKRA